MEPVTTQENEIQIWLPNHSQVLWPLSESVSRKDFLLIWRQDRLHFSERIYWIFMLFIEHLPCARRELFCYFFPPYFCPRCSVSEDLVSSFCFTLFRIFLTSTEPSLYLSLNLSDFWRPNYNYKEGEQAGWPEFSEHSLVARQPTCWVRSGGSPHLFVYL